MNNTYGHVYSKNNEYIHSIYRYMYSGIAVRDFLKG